VGGVSHFVRNAARGAPVAREAAAMSNAGKLAADAAAGVAMANANGTPDTDTCRTRQQGETLEQCVMRTLEQYFADLDGAPPHALHQMVMAAAERPLLKFAVERCTGNQSAAADLLGINRNTLRRKLQDHGLA